MSRLSKKKKTALERLKEIGIGIYHEDNELIDFMISHDLMPPSYIEIGFLLAQLSDVGYPEGYTTLGDLPSKIYPAIKEQGPVHFVESYPHGLKYRVYKKK